MKKYFFALCALAIIPFTSCQKTQNSPSLESPETLSEPLKIVANVDKLDTKTTYEKSGDVYEFSWVKNDRISVIIRDGSTYDRWEFETTADNPGASATFTSTGSLAAKWNIDNYAFYPKPNTGGFNYPNHDASPAITLSQEMSLADDSNPMQFIPMIGENNGDGSFDFKAATGVIKVSFTNLPSSITGHNLYLDLVTGQNGGTTPMSGVCAFPADKKTLAITSSPSQTKTIIYSSVTNASSVDFYFPIPACTIAARDMKLVLWNATLGYFFDHFVNPQEIVVERGVVSELPAINYSAIQGSLTYTGSLSTPKVTLTKGPRVAKVKYTIANTVTAGKTNLTNGIDVVELTSNGETTVTAPAASGSYYIVYNVLNSADELITTGSIPFAHIKSVADIAGTYKIGTGATNYTFDVADASEHGENHVKITQFNTDNGSYSTYDGITGSIYGVFNPTDGTLTFAMDDNNYLTKEANNYYVVGANSISTGTTVTADSNLVFRVANKVNDSNNKLVFSCLSTVFGITTTDKKGSGLQFSSNSNYYFQQ